MIEDCGVRVELNATVAAVYKHIYMLAVTPCCCRVHRAVQMRRTIEFLSSFILYYSSIVAAPIPPSGDACALKA
jgi:hypothetical protein